MLGYRSLATLIAVVGIAGSSTLGGHQLREIEVVTAAVLAMHLFVVIMCHRRLRPAAPWVTAADIGLAVGLNVWASAVVDPGSLFYDYGNPFSGYAVATVALWTGVKGRRFGLLLVAVMSGPIQMLMAAVNGTALTSIDAPRFLTRALWFVVAFVLAQLLLDALRRGAAGLAAESAQRGRLARREELLRDLHNGLLQALLGMEDRSTAKAADAAPALDEIGAEAQRWSSLVRARIASSEDAWNGLHAEMRFLVANMAERACVRPELRVTGEEPSLDTWTGRALVGAAGEALQNAERHSGATTLEVVVGAADTNVTVVVSDDGTGFVDSRANSGYGIAHSIRAALHGVGGSAEVRTAPGMGTAWTLCVPVRPQAAAPDVAVRATIDLALVPISYRLVGLAVSAAGLVGSTTFGPVALSPLLVVMGLVAFAHVFVIRTLTRFPSLPTKRWLAGLDIALAVALVPWAATAVPPGTVFLDYRDPFGLYLQATLALWGAVRGWVLGAALLVLFAAPLQLAMALANDVPLSGVDPAKLISRGLWLVPALLLGTFVMTVARRGALILAAEHHRGGLAAERSAALEDLHVAVLPGLDAISERTRTGTNAGDVTLGEIRRLVGREVARIRASLRSEGRSAGRWPELEALIAEIEGDTHARVELVCLGAWQATSADEARAMLATVARILRSAAAGGRCHATVFAEADTGGCRVVVRHDGRSAVASGGLVPPDGPIGVSVSATEEGHERWELTMHRVEPSLSPTGERGG